MKVLDQAWQKVHASLPLDILKHEEISLLLGELRSHGSEIGKLKSMLPKIFMHLITSLPKTLFFQSKHFMKMADIGYEMLSTFMEEHSIFMEEDSIFMEEPPYLIFTEDPLIKSCLRVVFSVFGAV